MIVDPALRLRLAGAGRWAVTTRFSFEAGVSKIAARLAVPSDPMPEPGPVSTRDAYEPVS